MARRIRWQLLIAAVSSLLVVGLMAYLALTTASEARPLTGGDYVEAVVNPPRQLNPLLGDPATDATGADIQALLFDGLVRVGADGLPVPSLAATLPEISESGLVYTFTLRPDVTWHDGTPLSADDVVFTLRAVQGSAFTGDPAAKALWRDVLVEKLDDLRVRCELTSAPFAPLVSLATFPILPAHLLRDLPPAQWPGAAFSQRPVGTGPYRLTELTSEHALLAANTNYYGGRPFIDTIELRFFAGQREAVAALTRAEVKGFGYVSSSQPAPDIPAEGFSRRTTALDSYTVLTFNLRTAPLSDQGLRRALASGLDKDALIAQVLGGSGRRIDTPILPGWWSAATSASWYPYSQARAAELLTSLGYETGTDGVRARDGVPLVLPLLTDDAPERLAAAQEVARQWAAIGVKVEIEQVSPETLRQRLVAHEFTMALHSWQRLGPDPDVFDLWHSDRAETGANYAGLQDTQIDQLLASARRDASIEARLAAYRAFQQRWIDLAPSLLLYQPLYVYITTNQLAGLEDAPPTTPAAPAGPAMLYGREDRFRTVQRWSLRSAREIRGDLRQTP